MRHRHLSIALGVAMACGVLPAHSGIPQPDAVLYGNIRLDGLPVAATDDVTVVARVDGVAEPVGRYKMGSSSVAGNLYVLRVRIDAAVAGSPVGANAAQLGQTVALSVQRGAGAETFIREYRIGRIGALQRLDLDNAVVPGQCATIDQDVALDDHQALIACVQGPGRAPSPGCDCADLDGDTDSDLLDWSRFQLQFTGSP
ncbi:MAG: hypothetical protein ACE5EX_11120 [Phycisphaerae bacterium]